MDFNLKYFRESILKLTQSEFAKMMNKSQNTISRWEKEPGNLSIDILKEISNQTGYSITDLLDTKPNINIPWRTNTDQWVELKELKQDIYKRRNEIGMFINGKGNKSSECVQMCKELDNIYNNVSNKIRKPRVAFLGNSDVGKSTLINDILGDEVLPVGWSPITSLAIKVLSIEEKPKFLKEANTIILSGVSGVDNHISAEDLKNRYYFDKYCLESGDKSLLHKYGSREGEMYKKDSKAEEIIIYVDSPILKSCELWDLPGYGTADNPEDDVNAAKGKNNADIFVYMSLANAFMRGTDILYLQDIIDTMTPLESSKNKMGALSNLFVVASQAHTVKPITDLENIMDKGADRMNDTLADNFWNYKSEITGVRYDTNSLKSRLFSYTRDDDNISSKFRTNFTTLLENISLQLNKNLREELKMTISTFNKDLLKEIKKVESYIKDGNKSKEDYEDLKSIEDEIYKNNKKFVRNLENKIRQYRNESISRFDTYYESFINEDSIVNMIEEKDYRNRKEDKEELQSFINNSLTQEVNDISYVYSNRLKEYLDAELDLLNIELENAATFDYKRAFLSGLAGASTYGAFTLYISTLGNLGGYILVTKVVGLLSKIGISVGGGAIATTTIAALGGPITIVIGLSVVAGALVATFTGLNWKNNLAKSLVKAYDKQEAKKQYSESLEKWWKETENAIDQDMMISDYKEQLKEAKEKANFNSQELYELHGCLQDLYELSEELKYRI